MEKNLLLFLATVGHFLVNDTKEWWVEEKLTKCDMGKGIKKYHIGSKAIFE